MEKDREVGEEGREVRPDDALKNEQKKLAQRLGKLIRELEQMEVKSLLDYYDNPRQVMVFNLVLGICRGVGFAVGATVVAALFLSVGIKVLSHFVDVPLIGKLIADIIHAMKAYESTGGAPPATK